MLLPYWRALGDKEALGVDCEEYLAEEHFKNYFNDLIETLLRKFKAARGFDSYDAYELLAYWERIPEAQRKKIGLDFAEPQNLVDALDSYLEKL